ncbi:MAG TPA: O-antigen ligase family protein [Thermoanaerobaculia bacterium]
MSQLPEAHETPSPWPDRAGYWLLSGHLLAVFGIAASNILLGLTLLVAPWTLRGRKIDWNELAPLTIPLGLYALWLVAAIFASFDPVASLSGARELFTLSGLLLAPLLIRGERDVRRLVNGMIVVGALLAATGLAQYLIGYGDIDRRIRGPFSHYMTFSGFLLICDLLVFASMAVGGRWRSLWRWAALAILNVALLGSLTRSAWVALALTLSLYLVVRAPRWLLLWVPAAVLFAVLAPPPLMQRVASISDLRDRSNYDRLCMLEAGLVMVRERPLFGLGPEMAERRYPIYRSPTAPRYEIPHLHNSFLQLAAERGLPAMAAYLAMLAGSAWVAWRGYVREGRGRGPQADLYLGAMLALFAFNVAGLFENNWGDTEVQRSALFLLAIPFCLGSKDEKDRKDAG